MIAKTMMKPTLRQYLSLCKAQRFLKENLNKDEEHYEPMKVQMLLGNIQNLNNNIAKSLKDDLFSFSLEACFKTLDSTLKIFQQTKQDDPGVKIYEKIQHEMEQDKINLYEQVDHAHDALSTIRAIQDKYLNPGKQPEKRPQKSAQKRRKQLDEMYQQRLNRLYGLLTPKVYVKKQISNSRIMTTFKKDNTEYFSKYKSIKKTIEIQNKVNKR